MGWCVGRFIGGRIISQLVYGAFSLTSGIISWLILGLVVFFIFNFSENACSGMQSAQGSLQQILSGISSRIFYQ